MSPDTSEAEVNRIIKEDDEWHTWKQSQMI
jgi:hypothetical protein